jgi:hypothetical protein
MFVKVVKDNNTSQTKRIYQIYSVFKPMSILFDDYRGIEDQINEI